MPSARGATRKKGEGDQQLKADDRRSRKISQAILATKGDDEICIILRYTIAAEQSRGIAFEGKEVAPSYGNIAAMFMPSENEIRTRLAHRLFVTASGRNFKVTLSARNTSLLPKVGTGVTQPAWQRSADGMVDYGARRCVQPLQRSVKRRRSILFHQRDIE